METRVSPSRGRNEAKQSEPKGGSLEYLVFNPFPPRLAKTNPFVILLCLTADNFLNKGELLVGKGLKRQAKQERKMQRKTLTGKQTTHTKREVGK